jgi:hypothetical protein
VKKIVNLHYIFLPYNKNNINIAILRYINLYILAINVLYHLIKIEKDFNLFFKIVYLIFLMMVEKILEIFLTLKESDYKVMELLC